MGEEVDYTLAGFADVPIGSFKVARLLSNYEAVTMFPVEIENYTQREPWYILHFWEVVDCVDESRSKFTKFVEDDPVRPDLSGSYSGFLKLAIYADKAQGKHVFRLGKSENDIIASEEIKRRFEDAKVTGAVFQDVTSE